MDDSFLHIELPDTLKVSSSGRMIPLAFFGAVIPISKKIQFKLGYFSSNSISTLSYGFAQFIYNGGSIDFLINHFVTEDDYKLINNTYVIDTHFYDSIAEKILTDIERLEDVLTKTQVSHFYNCLRYLLDHGRIDILPVTTENGEISHYKEALFWDKDDNVINIVGSCNFTYKGIVCNGESFIIHRSWGALSEMANIKNEIADYEVIFKRESKAFIYLPPEKLVNVIRDRSVSLSAKELLEEELSLVNIEIDSTPEGQKVKNVHRLLKEKFEIKVESLLTEPRFPCSFEPRDYQIEAYENWVNNHYSGIFGMATGTGKTKTSLNCVLKEYEKAGNYFVVILVPSIPLLNQWEEEVYSFNFQRVLKVGGGNNWEKDFSTYASNFNAGLRKNLIIISTYLSFASARFQKYFKQIEEHFLLIADEAHNMGATQIKRAFQNSLISKKIGLSATPKRIYDLEGTAFIDEFFKDREPYTFSFSMKQAMDTDFLTHYKYYPRVVELNDSELEDYKELSKKLLRYFDFEKGEFRKDPAVEMLLLKRKNIIHKAGNKIECFKRILLELKELDKLKYIFTYVPEGYVYSGGVGERMLDHFLVAAHEVVPMVRTNTYTSDGGQLENLLRGFADGRIDMLLAMKMLDEGVDVPRAEVGIFASSTGNPRQYIQRRGRLLRTHRDKAYATIYDMIVIPSLADSNMDFYNMERNLVHNELRRVGYFASLAMNFYDSRIALEQVCSKYNLDLDTIINEL